MPQPFELPEFYLSYPARLTPAWTAARAHTRQWAQQMGMVGAGPELDLVADWYMRVFYFGDHFLETFKRSRDPDGGRKHLNRLHSFMPQHPAESSPDPASASRPSPGHRAQPDRVPPGWVPRRAVLDGQASTARYHAAPASGRQMARSPTPSQQRRAAEPCRSRP